MHLGVKPRLRVCGLRPRPLCFPATVEDGATKAEPPGLPAPGAPLPPACLEFGEGGDEVGEGWC